MFFVLSFLIVYLFTLYDLIKCAVPWPGDSSVTVADTENEFGENLSGLYYNRGISDSASDDFLFGVMNSPSKIFKLQWNGEIFQIYSGIIAKRTLKNSFNSQKL